MAFPFNRRDLNGQRLGPYEILEPIGAGVMGEVWQDGPVTKHSF
jgi:hypothetical protein